MNIEFHGQDAIVNASNIAFTYSALPNPREMSERKKQPSTQHWNQTIGMVGKYTIFPYGANNDLPEVIREIVANHHAAPGMLNRKKEIVFGKGPILYKQSIKDNQIVRELVDDQEILDWLKSWDATDYLLQQSESYHHIDATFTRFEMSRGSRIGKPKIAKLTHINPNRCRLAAQTKDLINGDVERPTHAIVNPNWMTPEMVLLKYRVYELFDINNPFKAENNILYSNEYSFCQDVYTMPDIFGSLEWLKRSTAVPLIFKALSTNAINLKYHVESPQEFWSQKRKVLKNEIEQRGGTWKESILEKYKSDFLRAIATVLSGEENTGKFWHTEKVIDVMGTNIVEHGWTIKVIDQKIKDFVESHIKISETADLAVAAGVGLSPTMGNVNNQAKANSGSEQLYTYMNYLNSSVHIPEMVICKAINYAIQVNWPEKNIRLGFDRTNPKAQSDQTPSERLINQEVS